MPVWARVGPNWAPGDASAMTAPEEEPGLLEQSHVVQATASPTGINDEQLTRHSSTEETQRHSTQRHSDTEETQRRSDTEEMHRRACTEDTQRHPVIEEMPGRTGAEAPAFSEHFSVSDPSTARRRTVTTFAHERGRGLLGMIRAFRVPEENDRDIIFQAARHDGEDLFFRHLRLHSEGGLHKFQKEITTERMYNKERTFKVFLRLCLIVFNGAQIFSFWRDSMPPFEDREQYALTPLVNPKNNDMESVFFYTRALVSTLESIRFVTYFLDVVWIIIKFNCCTNAEDLKHYRIWHELYEACTQKIRRMTNYSAMQSLSILNPQTLRSKLLLELTKVEEGASKPCVLGRFIVMVLLWITFGLFAFLSKFTLLATQLQVSEQELRSGTQSQFWIVFELRHILGFLNQVCGITLVWAVNEARLFLFIFGGEDSKMQAGELDRQFAYLASVTKHLCEELWVCESACSRKFKRAVALLTFSDLDVQALILDEDESLEVDAEVLRRGMPVQQLNTLGRPLQPPSTYPRHWF